MVHLHIANVDRVDPRTIIGQQGSQRAPNHLAAVDDGDGVAVQAVAVGQDGVVHVQVLEDLDAGERRAWHDALLCARVRVQKADVLVHVGDVLVR